MKNLKMTLPLIILLGFFACSDSDEIPSGIRDSITPGTLNDTQATAETKALYKNLFSITERGIMFGRQIPTLYGLDNNEKWWANGSTDNSDTKFLTGSHPAVCGWELSNYEFRRKDDEDFNKNLRNIDGELFTDIREHIIAAYARGAVNTISWHCANPVTEGNSWDNTRAVYAILPEKRSPDGEVILRPEGDEHKKFKGWMDNIAHFLLDLKGPGGELIPIIFRPWHEHTGAGFWWGKGNATDEEFIDLYRFTVEYLRDVHGVHNLIYCYSPDLIHLSTRENYMEFWPGDDYVDLLGLDAYDREGGDYQLKCLQFLNIMQRFAQQKKMPMALTETGLENNDPEYNDYFYSDWWTRRLYKVMEKRPVCFVLLWRNGDFPSNGGHFFGAYRGCFSDEDFIEFASKDDILLERDLPDMYR